MLIGIDGNEANEVHPDIGAPAGVNMYALELLKAIHKLQGEWKKKYTVVVYLKSPPSKLLPSATKHFQYKVLPGRGLWIMTRLTPYLMRAKVSGGAPDVMFSPSHYSPFTAPIPKAVSIMDLDYLESKAHLKKKDFWQLKLWTARSIKAARAVFAISESTKREIVRHYQDQKDKVVVTHLAYDNKVFNKGTKVRERARFGRYKQRFSIGSDYLLYLGVIKPSKNVPALIEAWATIANRYSKYSLVVGGKKGWGWEDVKKEVEKWELEDRVIFTDYVPESDKAALIANAKLFVLPSFWEGFGLDILNAMASGVPVVASRVGSIPEVADDAGILFDPKDVVSIAASIEKVLKMDKTDYNKLVEKSMAQARKFSWEATARKTLETLESIARNN